MFSYPEIQEVKSILPECEGEILQDHVDDHINFFHEVEVDTKTQQPVESYVQENNEEVTEPELTEPDQIERQYEQVDSIQLEKECRELALEEEQLRETASRIAQRIAETAELREVKRNQIRENTSTDFFQEHQTMEPSDPSIFTPASESQRENQLRKNTDVVSNQEYKTNKLPDPSNTSKIAQRKEPSEFRKLMDDRSRKILDANFNRELEDFSPPTESSSRFYQQNAPASDTFKIGRTSATTLADTTRKTMNSDLWNSLSIREQYDKALELRELRKKQMLKYAGTTFEVECEVHSPPTTLSSNPAQQVALASELRQIRENQMRKNPDVAIAQEALSQDSISGNTLSQDSFSQDSISQNAAFPEVSTQEHQNPSMTSSVTQQNAASKLKENQIRDNSGAGSAQAYQKNKLSTLKNALSIPEQNELTSAFTKLRENQMRKNPSAVFGQDIFGQEQQSIKSSELQKASTSTQYASAPDLRDLRKIQTCENTDVVSADEHEKSKPSNPKKAKSMSEKIVDGICDIYVMFSQITRPI